MVEEPTRHLAPRTQKRLRRRLNDRWSSRTYIVIDEPVVSARCAAAVEVE